MSGGRLLSILIVVALFGLAGCRQNEAVYHHDGSRIIYMRPPLMKVVDELDERHLAVETVVARLNVTLKDNEKNKEFQLIGTYLGDRDGNLRLRITATTNQVILDMGCHDNIIDVHLPRKSRYFQGARQDLLNNVQCQLSLLAHAGRARDLFFPRAWSDNAIERRVTYERGREVISVIEKPNFIRRRSRRLSLAPESSVVETVEVYDKFGREVGIISYGDYQFPDPAVDKKETLNLIHPGSITLHSHDGLHTLVLSIEELHLNTAIPKDRFCVPQPENSKALDLGAALKRTGNLWE